MEHVTGAGGVDGGDLERIEMPNRSGVEPPDAAFAGRDRQMCVGGPGNILKSGSEIIAARELHER